MFIFSSLSSAAEVSCTGNVGSFTGYDGNLYPYLNATYIARTPAFGEGTLSQRYNWQAAHNSVTEFPRDFNRANQIMAELAPNYSTSLGAPPLYSVTSLRQYMSANCSRTKDVSVCYPLVVSMKHSSGASYLPAQYPKSLDNSGPDIHQFNKDFMYSPAPHYYPPMTQEKDIEIMERIFSMMTQYDRRVGFIPFIIKYWDKPSAHIQIETTARGTIKRFFYMPQSLLHYGSLNKLYKATDGKWYQFTLQRVLLHEMLHELINYLNPADVQEIIFSPDKRLAVHKEQQIVGLVNSLLSKGPLASMHPARDIKAILNTRIMNADGTDTCYNDQEHMH